MSLALLVTLAGCGGSVASSTADAGANPAGTHDAEAGAPGDAAGDAGARPDGAADAGARPDGAVDAGVRRDGAADAAPVARDGAGGGPAPDAGAPMPGRCGDGVVGAGEDCDDGNRDDTDGCLTSCQRDPGTLAPPAPRFDCPTGPAAIHVDGSHAGPSTGGEAEPYRTLQEAIAAAPSGATIRVAAGSYAGPVRVADKEVHLCGGYAAGFGARDSRTHPTVIEGDGAAPAVAFESAGRSSLVGFVVRGGAGGVDARHWAEGHVDLLVADNLVVDNARDGADNGGGLAVTNGDARIANNVIARNRAAHGGGIAATRMGRLVIEDNVVADNVGTSDHGGGLWLAATDARVTRNLIRGNVLEGDSSGSSTWGWGGGLIFFEGHAHLSFNVVTDNFAPSHGNGEFIDEGASALIEHELIYANRCPGGSGGGAGILVDGGLDGAVVSHVSIRSSTIAGHDCPGGRGGSGLLLQAGAEVDVQNCIFWGNGGEDFFVGGPSSTLAVAYTLSGQPYPGTGNLHEDPLFADPEAGDFHLRSQAGRLHRTASGPAWILDEVTSPAIDAGDPAADHSLEPAPNGGRIDLGVHGNTPEASRSVR